MLNSVKTIRFFICLLIFSVSFPIFSAKKAATLSQVLKPTCFQIAGDQLFIGDESAVHIYSIKEFKHLKRFGRVGRGPGEFLPKAMGFKPIPDWVRVMPDHIQINSDKRFLKFSREGKYLSEIRKPWHNMQLAPVGDGYAGLASQPSTNPKKMGFFGICIFDSKLELVKKLRPRHFPSKKMPPSGHFSGIYDYFGYHVQDDKIFVANSGKGIFIEMFDKNGTLLNTINKKGEHVKVTDELKTFYLNYRRLKAKKSPFANPNQKYHFFQYTPAFRGFRVAGEKIYIYTYRIKDRKWEIITMDFKGTELKRSFTAPMDQQLDYIYNDKYYYLTENKDNEDIELFVEDL